MSHDRLKDLPRAVPERARADATIAIAPPASAPAESLAPVPLRKHYVTNAVIELDASRQRATCVSYWRSPVGAVDPDTGVPAFFETGGRYVDTLEKRAEGWRIHERVVQAEWMIGEMPAPAGVEG